MPRKRKSPPPDLNHCRDCGAPIRLTPNHTREHRGALDTSRPVYLDMDQEPQEVAYEPRFGYAIRGTVVPDLSASEQRAADDGRVADSAEGVRRIIKCYHVHACDPAEVRIRRPAAPAPVHGGADRAAGEHLQ